MSEAFIHTCYIDNAHFSRDQRFAYECLVADTLAVYYWSEFFVDRRHTRKLSFCIIGQRGLAEYVAKIVPKVVRLIDEKTVNANETWGYKFGIVVALREALTKRRLTEMRLPEYTEQCNLSTYRARKQLNAGYKVGTRDQPVEYDQDGFRRGKEQIWTLSAFKTPIQVLNAPVR